MLLLVVLYCVLCTGCALLQAHGQMKQLDAANYYTGLVQTESKSAAPTVVVLYALGDEPRAVFVDVLAGTRRVYHLAAPPGEYGIFAFEDVNGDLKYQPGEPAALYRGVALSLDAIDDPPTPAGGLGRITIAAASPDFAAPPIFGDAYAELISRREEMLGAKVAPDGGRFSAAKVREGLFQPLQFVREGRSGLFLLEPFDPKRTPVIFVHGIGGSPLDWEYVIANLDRERFQPWVYFYPSGIALGLSGLMLSTAVDDLQRRFGFSTSVVVAHSMGGIVVRGALNIVQREGRTPPVHHLVSISTPWRGHAGARWADVGPTRVPGSWLDMAPDSAFLRDLAAVPRPSHIRYTLFFGYGGGSRFSRSSSDGTVTLESMLDPVFQTRADFVFGFDEDHTSILKSPQLLSMLRKRLEAAAGP